MTDEMVIVSKGWGYEKWIVNKPEYCGKLLFFHKGKRCSLHYHKLKDEMFYVQSGEVLLRWTDDRSICSNPAPWPPLNEVVLFKGDSFHIPPGRVHQMIAYLDTELFEFSTQHFDSDSYRIAKGD